MGPGSAYFRENEHQSFPIQRSLSRSCTVVLSVPPSHSMSMEKDSTRDSPSGGKTPPRRASNRLQHRRRGEHGRKGGVSPSLAEHGRAERGVPLLLP